MDYVIVSVGCTPLELSPLMASIIVSYVVELESYCRGVALACMACSTKIPMITRK